MRKQLCACMLVEAVLDQSLMFLIIHLFSLESGENCPPYRGENDFSSVNSCFSMLEGVEGVCCYAGVVFCSLETTNSESS